MSRDKKPDKPRVVPKAQVRRIAAFCRGDRWQLTHIEANGRHATWFQTSRANWDFAREHSKDHVEESSGRFNAKGEFIERPFFVP